MKIKPLGERVLIKINSAEEKTANGLFIPQEAQEKTNKGVVVEVGTGDNRTISNKDIVMYDKYSGTLVKIDGADHLILDIKDIVAIVED